MNLIDRVFCLIQGHTWERLASGYRCPHCELRVPGILRPPPKRVW